MLPQLWGELLLCRDPVPLLSVSTRHRAWPTVNIQKVLPLSLVSREQMAPSLKKVGSRLCGSLRRKRGFPDTVGVLLGALVQVGWRKPASSPLLRLLAGKQRVDLWALPSPGDPASCLLTPLTKKTPRLREHPGVSRPRGPREQTNTPQNGSFVLDR